MLGDVSKDRLLEEEVGLKKGRPTWDESSSSAKPQKVLSKFELHVIHRSLSRNRCHLP